MYAESNFTVQAGSSRIATTVSGDFPKLSQEQLMDWVQNAATAIIAYYGRYPVPHVDLRIRSFDGAGVRGGQTFCSAWRFDPYRCRLSHHRG